MDVQEHNGHEKQLREPSPTNPLIRFASTPLVWINIVADGSDNDEWPEDPAFFSRFRRWMSDERIFAANVPSSWGGGRHSTAFHKKDAPRVIAWLNDQGCLPAKELEV
jgi:hypothetical protein